MAAGSQDTGIALIDNNAGFANDLSDKFKNSPIANSPIVGFPVGNTTKFFDRAIAQGHQGLNAQKDQATRDAEANRLQTQSAIATAQQRQATAKTLRYAIALRNQNRAGAGNGSRNGTILTSPLGIPGGATAPTNRLIGA